MRGISSFVVAGLLTCGLSTVWGQTGNPQELTLLVPGGAGGGWDLTARAMKDALETERLARVRIELSPGPGGSVGLAQLLSGHRGDEHTLLVGGLVMLSAATSQHLAISLLDATAIARLTGDYPVVVVPSSSPYRNVTELMAAVAQDTSAFPWAGGSSGSLYERLAGDLYEAAGLSRSSVNYVPHTSGREVSESLLIGRARVGLSEAAEVEPYVARGDLRPLAVAASTRVAGLDVPTLKDAGYDVVAVNWRGVFAGPGVGKAGQDRLEDLMARMVATPTWKDTLAKRRWTDLHLGAAPFEAFVEAERSRWSVPPKATELPAVMRRLVRRTSSPGGDLGAFVLIGIVMVLAGTGALLWRYRFARNAPPPDLSVSVVSPQAQGVLLAPSAGPTQAHDPQLETSSPDHAVLEPHAPEPKALPSLAVQEDEVTRAFDEWKLTAAERDIAEMMLQGLRYKQIAGNRGTSERTVRQQAQVILKKAGLDGRADLAAHFIHVSRRTA